jgi:hypothetical protein
VHHQQLDVLDVVDEEGLVARGHHVAGLLVGSVTDLHRFRLSVHFAILSGSVVRFQSVRLTMGASVLTRPFYGLIVFGGVKGSKTYGGHGHGSTEASSDTVVNTLGLAPAGVEALEPITLVTVEARSA